MVKIAPDSARPLVRRGLLTLWIISCVACGGDDTSRVDAAPGTCDCPKADTLTADRIKREQFDLNAYTGQVVDCSGDDQMLFGASCLAQDATENYVMSSNGYFHDREHGSPGWTCAWDNSSVQRRNYTTTVLCLDHADPADLERPEECGCEDVEPMDMRLFRTIDARDLPAGEMVRATSTCYMPGDVTIGGGCTVKDNDAWPDDDSKAHLVSSGFSPDGKEWYCDWQVTSDRDLLGAVSALCAAPPPDDTVQEDVPLPERVVRVEEEFELLQGGVFREEVTCEEGDFLIRGGCTVDSPLELARDVQLLSAGFPEDTQSRPNTWVCEWWVPLGATEVKARATAICLKPLESAE